MSRSGDPPFRSVENLKVCLDVLEGYMRDKYGFDVMVNDPDHKMTMYNIMTDTAKKHPPSENLSRRDMNNLLLNAVRDHYVRKFNIGADTRNNTSTSTNAKILERKGLPPMARAVPKTNTVAEFNAVELARKHEMDGGRGALMNKQRSDAPFKEMAFDPSEFERKLFALREMREDAPALRLQENIDMQRIDVVPPSAKELRVAPLEASRGASKAEPIQATQERSQFVAPPAPATYTNERYLIVNGFDRDWGLYKHRYNIVADFSAMADDDLHQRYKNIRSIGIKRIIIPQEVHESASASLQYPRTGYNHPFSFSVPYVMITIDEISSVFDGTNDVVRRGFCQMIVDKHYHAPNGRGFFVLQTMQDEKKTFYPTPLSGLTRLTIGVRKPNGELYNMSTDDYKVVGVQHDDLNPHFLMLVMDKYFDKNEFSKGDIVRLRNFGSAGATATSAARRVIDYINRYTGHVISEMGQPNTSGYYKSVFIRAPGAFDAVRGVDATDIDAVAAIVSMEDAMMQADIMNTTLQCTFSFKIETVCADYTAESSYADLVTA